MLMGDLMTLYQLLALFCVDYIEKDAYTVMILKERRRWQDYYIVLQK
jgi:hypothetical protein